MCTSVSFIPLGRCCLDSCRFHSISSCPCYACVHLRKPLQGACVSHTVALCFTPTCPLVHNYVVSHHFRSVTAEHSRQRGAFYHSKLPYPCPVQQEQFQASPVRPVRCFEPDDALPPSVALACIMPFDSSS